MVFLVTAEISTSSTPVPATNRVVTSRYVVGILATCGSYIMDHVLMGYVNLEFVNVNKRC